ncbi:MAG: aspartate--tRNA ligase [bacterium]|nr:aspartate--tRNA ligase [bacterium]
MNRILTSQTPDHKGEVVVIAGWVHTRRDHGKITFLDMRDREGLVQVVCTPQAKDAYETAQKARTEWVLRIEGMVQERPEGTKNPDIATGTIEIVAQAITVYSQAKTLPFAIDTDGYEIGEEKRLQYRYLDLRRPRLLHNLVSRHRVLQFMRDFLSKEGFIEIETPILTKSTPEGARDFVVPSRLYPGTFYALPQSPQQYKQLLQVAGIERYFQIARCFRDEDPRADRQPEFTQLDIEMSFVTQEEIMEVIERLYTDIVKTLFPEKRIQKSPFPRHNYKDVMEKYNSDKPDLRENKEDPNELAFAFVVNFPMFEWKKQENRWDAVHHPFTRPQTENIEAIKKDPGSILAFQYDLVLNGYEIAGGSLRTYRPDLLAGVFELMGNKKEDIQTKFGHLLEAFEYGVPPHGGIASGLERFLAVLLGEPNIREVMAFPKTGDSRDLMMHAPSELDPVQLKELGIETKKKLAQKKK